MPFIDEQDIRNLLREDHLYQIIEDDECILEMAVEDAKTIIENKLDELYDFSTLWDQQGANRNKLAVLLVKILVIHLLYQRTPDDDVPDSVRDNWKWAMDTLCEAAKGKPINLPKKTVTDAEGNDSKLTIRRWNSDARRTHGLHHRNKANPRN